MAAVIQDNVDYRLLNRLSDLVICSSCLQNGKVTPVPQVISERHTLTNECSACRQASGDHEGHRAPPGTLLRLAH